jgi:16S rRNA G966 N2-methylase RsmD
VQKGDLIIMGDHKLLCASSTDIHAVQKLFGEHKATAIYSDPPFNIGFQSRASQFTHTQLRWLRFQFFACCQERQKCEMDVEDAAGHLRAQLAHGFQEGLAFNITYRSAN